MSEIGMLIVVFRAFKRRLWIRRLPKSHWKIGGKNRPILEVLIMASHAVVSGRKQQAI